MLKPPWPEKNGLFTRMLTSVSLASVRWDLEAEYACKHQNWSQTILSSSKQAESDCVVC